LEEFDCNFRVELVVLLLFVLFEESIFSGFDELPVLLDYCSFVGADELSEVPFLFIGGGLVWFDDFKVLFSVDLSLVSFYD